MSKEPPKLVMLCGKIAAGKSTLSRKLAQGYGAVLLSEDAWLGALFADQMTSGADYLRCSAKLRTAMVPHITQLLRVGVSVVLDFPANTKDQRRWMTEIVNETGCTHECHVLDVPDEICLARLHARNASGDHPFAVTDAQFHNFSKHFDPPGPEEGLSVTFHTV